MEKYTNYCTDEQTKRAYKLGALCEVIHDYGDDGCGTGETWDNGHFLIIPTTQQLIGWLREEMNIDISIIPNRNREYKIYLSTNKEDIDFNDGFIGTSITYKQAELASIDAALTYLEKG